MASRRAIALQGGRIVPSDVTMRPFNCLQGRRSGEPSPRRRYPCKRLTAASCRTKLHRAMDPRVSQLHCIMPIANLRSVMVDGILSYERAARTQHVSVAMQPVQNRRDVKRVPGGLRLHQYANLYFDARNPMLYVRRAEASSLCILSISRDVLALPGVVITDCNAASDYARFLDPRDWSTVVFDDVFARDWTHPGDTGRQWQHKARKCAEVLVPGCVPPELIRGAYVRDAAADGCVAGAVPTLRRKVVPDMFFSS